MNPVEMSPRITSNFRGHLIEGKSDFILFSIVKFADYYWYNLLEFDLGDTIVVVALCDL